MPKGILVVQTRPVSAEREDEYNKWYSEEHVPDILKIPGFVGARRYRVRDTADVTADPGTLEYITIYEIEADDLATPLQDLRASSNAGRVRRSSSLQTDPPPIRTFYELID
ncbi:MULTISPECIES: DUF4286 family protein [Parafrankia]|uniref:Ethyl tert-butyl ether degradation protein EthD n=1 Tax=Parafrankia soli TaxID=2599596 RepID=A0A1S1PD72_9ACTN|nr:MULTISPECIES: DUF4286 family protein [Parafrankia]OHV19660.1 hypothetical protein BBK14_09150 [Parafrankia soli]TCJ34878.1 hypothetical protein E0504_30420 [Parafrankia sp. BMG5.11]CAI7975993.1 conserved hypothetical protein [Frankia sp. Hr75.2]SQE00318.1 conserved hypothetical protein [Parafrankia sp. Ea1.12]